MNDMNRMEEIYYEAKPVDGFSGCSYLIRFNKIII